LLLKKSKVRLQVIFSHGIEIKGFFITSKSAATVNLFVNNLSKT